MQDQYSRTQMLLGAEAMTKLHDSRVAVFGVGGVGGVPILPPVGPSCAWRGAAVSGSVCQFRVCSCVLGQCTRSVGNAPLLFGCTAT